MRTQVAPSSMATSRSFDMPIESSGTPKLSRQFAQPGEIRTRQFGILRPRRNRHQSCELEIFGGPRTHRRSPAVPPDSGAPLFASSWPTASLRSSRRAAFDPSASSRRRASANPPNRWRETAARPFWSYSTADGRSDGSARRRDRRGRGLSVPSPARNFRRIRAGRARKLRESSRVRTPL